MSLYSVWKRFEVESENRSVAIAAEFDTIGALGASQGMPISQALQDARAQGLSAVVLGEGNISEILSEGRAGFVAAPTPADPSALALRLRDPAVGPRLMKALQIRFGALAQSIHQTGNTISLPPVSPSLIRSTPTGLSEVDCQTVRNAGLVIVARCANAQGESAAAVSATLTWAHSLGATVFLPEGDQVLGRRDALPTTIASLHSLGMLYASPEFAKIGGDSEVVQSAPDLVVRLHSAQTAELDKLSPIDAVERYVRAARERNMRILLLRPVSLASSQPLADFDSFIRSIRKDLVEHGLSMGAPRPFQGPHLPKAFFVVLGLAVAPIAWFTLAHFVAMRRSAYLVAFMLGLFGLACWTRSGRELMALLGAISLPVQAFLLYDACREKLSREWAQVILGFFMISAISLVGGLIVAGLLNGLPFYVKAAEFRAVKVAMFVPILLIGWHYFATLCDWRAVMRSPITWTAAALAFALAAVLGLMLARTGNDSGVGPSGTEMIFRNLLDRYLYVRPRTKEFLIGHPALIVALGMLYQLKPAGSSIPRSRIAGWTALALMIGAIGQTDVVNTLCHLHIPVALSLARIGEGLVLGSIIGFVCWFIVGRFFRRWGA